METQPSDTTPKENDSKSAKKPMSYWLIRGAILIVLIVIIIIAIVYRVKV